MLRDMTMDQRTLRDVKVDTRGDSESSWGLTEAKNGRGQEGKKRRVKF